MPTYDFECKNCGTVHEIFRRLTEEKPKTVDGLDEACCDSGTEVFQVFLQPPYMSIRTAVSDIKKIGHLAERNSESLSNDQKMAIHAKNRTQRLRSNKDLPEGMTRLQTNEPMNYDDIVEKASEQKEREMTHKKINKMTNKEKSKWIKDG
tara:strand:- start:191 stop:640 length:450 start_codon:yes stop_codon:yes gene_type:complete